jgi:hypothetical protein
MAKPVFSVMTLIPAKTGFAWWSIEVGDDTDVDAIYEALRSDGLLRCTRVTSDPVRSHRVIRSREPMVLGKGIVATITPSHVELVEAEDARRAS